MITVPLRTVPGLNAREHFAVRSKRVRKEREAVAWILRDQPKPLVPCTVVLTRVAPSAGVDDDNLVGALKGVRDEIAKWLGVDDRHRNQVRYRYAEARGEWGVRIDFGPPVVGAQLAFDIADEGSAPTQRERSIDAALSMLIEAGRILDAAQVPTADRMVWDPATNTVIGGRK